MRHRGPAYVGSLMLGIAVLPLSTSRLVAQAPTPKATKAVAAKGSTWRTPWGDPDLQGVWNSAAGTPLERPSVFEGKAFLTDDELAQAEQHIRDRSSADRRDGVGLTDLRREHNEFWFAKRTTILTKRTSLITDPPDGKLPPLTPEAAERPVAKADEFRSADSCGDSLRVCPTSSCHPAGQPSASPATCSAVARGFAWSLGGSDAGRRDDEFSREAPFSRTHRRASTCGRTLHTRRGRQHRLSIHGRRSDNMDEAVDRSRSIAKTDGEIFEFACHEGNYGLRNILSVARARESLR